MTGNSGEENQNVADIEQDENNEEIKNASETESLL